MSGDETYYVLDAGDRIVQVEGAARETLGTFLGHPIWDASPGAASLFGPYFAEARDTGRELEFVTFYAGRVARRRVVPSGDQLTVYVTPLVSLDVRTLGTLAASLRRVEGELAARAPAPPDPRAPASLRALP